MILLKELNIKDYISHEKTTIVFKENDKLLLSGRSGSGKSSIPEAILWALYGRGRSDNRALVRRGAKSATVSLKLVDGGLETLITRTVSAAGKNLLNVTQNTGKEGQFLPIERTGIRDIQDWIERGLLHASYELFTNSVAYPQENENSFVKANASRRKDLLLEIVRAGNFDQLYEKARKTLTEKETESTVATSKMISLEVSIKQGKETISKIDSLTKDVEKFSNELETYNLLMKDLEKKANNITGLAKQITDKKSMGQMIQQSLIAIETQRAKDNQSIEDHNKIDIQKARNEVEELKDIDKQQERIEQTLKDNADRQMKINAHLANKPQITDFVREIELINERLIPLIEQSGECPSGDKCPFVKPIKGQIAFLTEQIENKTNQNKREKQDMLGWEKMYAEFAPLKDTDVLYQELQKLKKIKNDLSESKQVVLNYESFDKVLKEIKEREEKAKVDTEKYTSDLTLVNKEIKEYEEELEKTDSNQINIDLANLNISILDAQNAKEQASADLIIATRTQDYVKNAISELSGLKKGMSKLDGEIESLVLLKEALSPKGIKAVAVDYVVPQLEESINQILGQMSDFRIRLDTQQSKVKEEDGQKEGLFITVINDRGDEMAYENYSGGEKVKITTAISEAMALLVNVGFRIMDENIVSLDAESTEGFMQVLEQLQDKFPQLIIISHLQDVKDLFVNQMTILKTNGVSKIK